MPTRRTILAKDPGSNTYLQQQQIRAPSGAFGDFSGYRQLAEGLGDAAKAAYNYSEILQRRNEQADKVVASELGNRVETILQNAEHELNQSLTPSDETAAKDLGRRIATDGHLKVTEQIHADISKRAQEQFSSLTNGSDGSVDQQRARLLAKVFPKEKFLLHLNSFGNQAKVRASERDFVLASKRNIAAFNANAASTINLQFDPLNPGGSIDSVMSKFDANVSDGVFPNDSQLRQNFRGDLENMIEARYVTAIVNQEVGLGNVERVKESVTNSGLLPQTKATILGRLSQVKKAETKITVANVRQSIKDAVAAAGVGGGAAQNNIQNAFQQLALLDNNDPDVARAGAEVQAANNILPIIEQIRTSPNYSALDGLISKMQGAKDGEAGSAIMEVFKIKISDEPAINQQYAGMIIAAATEQKALIDSGRFSEIAIANDPVLSGMVDKIRDNISYLQSQAGKKDADPSDMRQRQESIREDVQRAGRLLNEWENKANIPATLRTGLSSALASTVQGLVETGNVDMVRAALASLESVAPGISNMTAKAQRRDGSGTPLSRTALLFLGMSGSNQSVVSSMQTYLVRDPGTQKDAAALPSTLKKLIKDSSAMREPGFSDLFLGTGSIQDWWYDSDNLSINGYLAAVQDQYGVDARQDMQDALPMMVAIEAKNKGIVDMAGLSDKEGIDLLKSAVSKWAKIAVPVKAGSSTMLVPNTFSFDPSFFATAYPKEGQATSSNSFSREVSQALTTIINAKVPKNVSSTISSLSDKIFKSGLLGDFFSNYNTPFADTAIRWDDLDISKIDSDLAPSLFTLPAHMRWAEDVWKNISQEQTVLMVQQYHHWKMSPDGKSVELHIQPGTIGGNVPASAPVPMFYKDGSRVSIPLDTINRIRDLSNQKRSTYLPRSWDDVRKWDLTDALRLPQLAGFAPFFTEAIKESREAKLAKTPEEKAKVEANKKRRAEQFDKMLEDFVQSGFGLIPDGEEEE